MSAITVTNLGKAYKQYPTRWSRLREWLDPCHKPRHHLHWVLQDINFHVKPGEAVGIIGINGAGKSTLLKMITGTTQPTTGSIHITGRVAALLELGMGFHPDFTGRQNAFMAGQLLGYSVKDIACLMPDIEAFAEIGEYIDQPVRVYSSGMQMRLAFSVATAIRPDVLIVDEALSVGDTYFQHKSFARIREYGKQGTTLLIVSHDKGAIQSICDHAILLNGGRLAMEGEPEAVMDYYNALLADHEAENVKLIESSDKKIKTESGSGEALIEDVALLGENGQKLEVAGVGQQVGLRVSIRCQKLIPEIVVGFMIKDLLGQSVFGTNTYHLKQRICAPPIDADIAVYFEFPVNIGPGSYSISVALHADSTHVMNNYYWCDRALIFNVVNMNKSEFIGLAWLPTTIKRIA